ncbi:MAG: hypothetical protein ACRDRH_12810 [Pseudonocardia sp.]
MLAADDPELLITFAEHALGHADLEVHDRLMAILAADDPHRPEIVTRRARLLTEG